jgi:hypothetical protein
VTAPHVRLAHLRDEDPDIWPEGSGYTVDVAGLVPDTTSQWFPQHDWVEATRFAERVAVMLQVDIVYPTGERWPMHAPVLAEGGRRCDFVKPDGSRCNLLPEEHPGS